MCLDMGLDFWCAYRGVWVAKSEYNSIGPNYHEPKDGVPYVAASRGECKCLMCEKTDKIDCQKCDNPRVLAQEQAEKNFRAKYALDEYGNLVGKPGDLDTRSRCSFCMAQYRLRGILK